MKIPHISNANINNAFNFTVKSGKRILKNTKKCVEQVGDKGKKAVTAAMFVSGGLNPQFANKSANLALNRGDAFIRTNPGVVSDCFTLKSSSPSLKKSAAKIPVIKSAKDVLLEDDPYKTAKELNVLLNDLLITKGNKTNPIKNKAAVFLNKAEKYNVNPVLLMAISMAESSRGTSVAARTKNNIGGIMGRKGLRKFPKVEDCIEAMAETVAKHHKESHLNTLEELGRSGKYCDKSVAEKWIKHVMFYVKKLS